MAFAGYAYFSSAAVDAADASFFCLRLRHCQSLVLPLLMLLC